MQVKHLLSLAALLMTSACSQSADVVYTNGRIYTVNEAQPWAEAVAIKDGKFLVVGSNADVEAVTGSGTEVVDLGGEFVMPGIVDAHIHPYENYVQQEAGNLLFSDQLDADGVAAAIREFAAANPDRQWIRGLKYGFGAFPGAKMTKEWLDEVVPDRPAYMVDESGHNATANSLALEIAGITADTPDPPLGAIDRDPVTGEPTGYLSETAMGLVGRHIDRPSPDAYKRAMARSLEQMTAWGITSFIDMMALESSIDAYFEFEAEGRLPFRMNVALAMNEYTDEVLTAQEARDYLPRAVERATEKIDTRHFKFWADGTPISYTSLLVEPYADRDTYGSITMTDEMIEDAIGYLGQGLGGHMHSITDGTARRVLDIVEQARGQYPGQVRRFHIGHSQLVHPDDYARFIELDVVAEIGPAMWFPFGATPVLKSRFGEERAARYFDIRAMLDAGITVAWGSDWPAGTPDANPFRGLEGLVTRAHPSGDYEGTWGEPITLEEGIRILTMGSAYAMEREDSIGSIEVGKHADFIVLDRDLFEIAPETIYDTVVKRTVFAGETVYQGR
ncbi:MAG: amidohydrolase [Gemmatimonadota bacterium]|nr:MAG: amidohydrolase [Gemmatimonadota bacterium]